MFLTVGAALAAASSKGLVYLQVRGTLDLSATDQSSGDTSSLMYHNTAMIHY